MNKHTSRKSTIQTIILVLLILLVGCLIAWLLMRMGSSDMPLDAPTVEEEIVKNEDSIAIPGYEGLILKANSKKQEISLKNPAENTCYFVITLYLEDGTELWRSEWIKAGEVSKPIRLKRELEPGNYPALLKYDCYRMDKDKTPLNGAQMKLTLRVKE